MIYYILTLILQRLEELFLCGTIFKEVRQMTVIFFILTIVFLYISIYAFYFAIISFMSRYRRKFVRNGMYNKTNYNNNIVVIVYAHNQENSVASLLEMLNKQKYPKENFKTYIILDNCTDNSSNRLETIGGANIFRVGESYTVGRDESISQLLDRLIVFKNINAYVFLGANRCIDENFIASVNQGLMTHDVLVGSTVLKGSPSTLQEKIIDCYNTYENNILNTSRSMLGLSTLINSECCAIKQNVIEKVQCIDFKDLNSELKYSVMLSKLNYKTSFDPNIITYLDRENYEIRKPSFSYKISLLKNSLPILLKSNALFGEFVLSVVQPCISVLILLMIFYAWLVMGFSIEEPFGLILNSVFYLCVSGLLVISFIYSLLNSKLSFKESLYFCMYPVYSAVLLLRKCPVIKQICDITQNVKRQSNIEKHSIPVLVSAGDKKMKCKIDLIENNGMIKAVFSFKNKKQSTDYHLSAYDAIKNISNMLAEKEYEIVDPETKQIIEHGSFDLEICQNCKYFTTRIDGINIVKGTCSCQESNITDLEKIVMLWQHCDNYAQAKEKIVDINNYRKDN